MLSLISCIDMTNIWIHSNIHSNIYWVCQPLFPVVGMQHLTNSLSSRSIYSSDTHFPSCPFYYTFNLFSSLQICFRSSLLGYSLSKMQMWSCHSLAYISQYNTPEPSVDPTSPYPTPQPHWCYFISEETWISTAHSLVQ